MPRQPIAHVWVVHDRCDCEDDYCHGQVNVSVFVSEQTARQEADLRSKRYGGHDGRPDMHIDKVPISTKITGF